MQLPFRKGKFPILVGIVIFFFIYVKNSSPKLPPLIEGETFDSFVVLLGMFSLAVGFFQLLNERKKKKQGKKTKIKLKVR